MSLGGARPAACEAATWNKLTSLRGASSVRQHSQLDLAVETDEQKETPIQRVVKLLEEMKAQLEQEMTADKELYDKMVCWCQTGNKEKTQAIADADASISQLEAETAERSGRGAELATKVDALKVELAQQKASLKQARDLREKEHADFNSAEKDMDVAMLRNAIVVLGRHRSEAFLQDAPALRESLGAALRWAALRHEELADLRSERRARDGDAVVGVKSAEERQVWNDLVGDRRSVLPVQFAARMLANEAAQGTATLLQHGAKEAGPYQSYAPQSGQILGMLEQMQEDFEANLSEAQKEELQAQEQYVALKAALEEQITTSMAKLDELEREASANAKALSDAKEDLATTRETRSADVKFLSDLRLQCQDLDHEYKQRSTARGEEIKAVAEAVAILTEDDARSHFHTKMGTGASLIQVVASSSNAESALRSRAVSLLLSVHGEPLSLGSPLSTMAVRVQLDSFGRVKEAIDTMVAELKTQHEEEVKHKAFCTDGLQGNEKETYAVNQTLLDLRDHIGELGDTLEKLVAGIAEAQQAISSTQVEVKKAGEVRALENKDFQEEVLDQRTIQDLVGKAIDRLKLVYKDGSFVQKDAKQSPESPVKFQPMKQNAGASPVISLMEQVVEDAKSAEATALATENKAQAEYEAFVRDSESAIRALQDAIATKTKAKAAAEADKAEKEEEEQNTEGRLDGLAQVARDLHEQCDFVLRNFDIRQKSRLQEIEALGQVKAMLSGMQSS
eukprot:CAMPEP_0176211616 /NCGR_PEP_ID=MMETSP0121_2-20121125/14743_1 /TAXON_ID=160619 /ORGANISM="Kryptoperidinium foliaceum, Strain CCMP 1326" /LENGTH=737 /DNA_ID=CAMNT_0017550669 /DNA_START=65 /DNA_END=2280 /DNA_ORIENTATION=+